MGEVSFLIILGVPYQDYNIAIGCEEDYKKSSY